MLHNRSVFSDDKGSDFNAFASFSVYKNLLADNRRSFKFQNIKEPLIVQCNTNVNLSNLILKIFKKIKLFNVSLCLC